MPKELKIKWTPIKKKVVELKTWEQNPRTLTSDNYEKLKRTIVEQGFHDVLKVNTDFTILSGNQRKQALLELKVEDVWVLVPERELTDKEMYAVSVASNLHYGAFDFDILATQLDKQELLELGMSPNLLDMQGVLGENVTLEKQAKEKSMIIQFNIIFDSEEQQETWYTFVGKLKTLYPDAQTLGERLEIFINNYDN